MKSEISQRLLAQEAGLSPAAVNNLLRHGAWPINPDHRRRLESALSARGIVIPAEAGIQSVPKIPKSEIRNPKSKIPKESPMPLDPSDLRHFGLARNPFSAARVNSEAAVLPPDEHSGAVQRIKEAAAHGEFIILVGPQGTGKTTALDAAEDQLARDDRYKIIRILNPQTERLRYGPIIQAIGLNLGTVYNGFNYDRTLHQAREILIRKPDLRPVIIIDDCHALASQTLYAVKRLWDNVKYGYRHLFAIVLIAQDSIQTRIDNLREVGTHADLYNIWGLRNPDEVQAYITKKLKALKAENVFDAGAAETIWRCEQNGKTTRGWIPPRHLNKLCCDALHTAAELGAPSVTGDIIEHLYAKS